MAKLKIALPIALLLLGSLLVALPVYCGLFQSVLAYESVTISVSFFYKNYQKQYMDVQNEIQADYDFINTDDELKSKLGTTLEYMGLYYDDPDQLDDYQLPRSTIGFYVADNNISLDTIIKTKVQGYEVVRLNATKAVQAYLQYQFPHSLWIAIMKLYNPVFAYLSANKLINRQIPFIEYIHQGNYILSYPIGPECIQFKLTNISAPRLKKNK